MVDLGEQCLDDLIYREIPIINTLLANLSISPAFGRAADNNIAPSRQFVFFVTPYEEDEPLRA